jgi:oligopeptide/dipeptide ABC transporter ATP-binding protein
MPDGPLIEVRNASKIYAAPALADFSMTIHADKPSITAVVGESGSGKTTLARLMLGLIAPTTGQVLYKGLDLATLRGAGRREFLRDVQAIFQDPYGVFNPFYRVDHVLTTPVARFRLAANKAAGRQLIEEALRSVGLQPEEILGRFPHQLSGGQRQRIMVARALLLRPKLIVADEPVSMVDASLRATILGTLRKLNQEMGISILYITHDLATAYQVSDTVLVMYRARVAEAGGIEAVVKHPNHPYTKLLLSSIPKVSTTRDWLAGDGNENASLPLPLREGGTLSLHDNPGCAFAPRCPLVRPACRVAPPPLFRTGDRQAAACYEYESAPRLDGRDMDRVLTG